MKTLILFYSRTGTTRIVAEKIAAALDADIEEVIDKKDRSGPIGWILAGRDAMKKNLTEIGPLKKILSAYDLVVIGTPVWAGTMTPAIRTVLTEQKQNLKNLAFFTTQGGANEQKVFSNLEELTGVTPITKIFLTTKEVKNNQVDDKIKEFVDKCG
jgi:flavodoxin